MKNVLTGLLAFFGLLFLTNCTPQQNTTQQSNASDIKREWMLVEFKDFSKDLMVASKANINLAPVDNSGNRYSAHMGCNNMFFTATFLPSGNVKFSEVGSTLMYCDKTMDLETAFGKALPTITKYQVNGHYLTLSNAGGEQMKFVAADWD